MMKKPLFAHPLRYLLFMLLVCLPLPGYAVFLSFEDLPQYNIDDPLHMPPDDTVPNPVTTQYAHLGVVFDGAGVSIAPGGVKSGSQSIADNYGPEMAIRFTGDLPSYVSFYLSALFEDKVFMRVFDQAGALIGETASDGWFGVVENSQPYTPLQFFEFSGTQISEISLSSFYSLRSGIQLDDLTFTRAQSVPEPSSLLMAIIAVMGLLAARHCRSREKHEAMST